MNDIADIQKELNSVYYKGGKLDFSFTSGAVKNNPYKSLIQNLENDFLITETTDLNTDVSYCYSIECADFSLGLMLSMVGNYGFLYRDNYEDLSKSEKSEIEILIKKIDLYSVKLLSKEVVSSRSKIDLWDEKKIFIFRALFSSILPSWLEDASFQEHLNSVVKLSAPKRYNYFIKKVADFEVVWGLYNDGWALSETESGAPIFPFWPQKEFAKFCATGDWEDYEPEEIPLEDFRYRLLPMIERDGVLPGIFYTLEDGSVDADVPTIQKDIRLELDKLE